MNKYLINKQILDLVLTLILLPIAIPLMIIFAVILFVELREFPFYFQRRGLTLDKNLFTIIKLKTIKSRTALENIDKQNSGILNKPFLNKGITPFSSWLRRTGLDEMPQIFNIIFGQISFIGPRPLMLSDLEKMQNEFPEYYLLRQNITAKPGISGMWQIFCNRDEGVKNLIALDSIYDEYKSIALDIKIILFTIPVVLTGSNADSIVTKSNFPMKGYFGLSSTTLFNIIPPNKNLADSILADIYSIEVPGNWLNKSVSSNSSSKKTAKIITIDSSERFKKTGTY